MERIQVLIDKLQEQSNRGESPAQLLLTVQILQQELMNAQQNTRKLGSAKVAVVMPTAPNYHKIEPQKAPVNAVVEEPALKEVEYLAPVPEPVAYQPQIPEPRIPEPVT